jgi:hypothetical protein
MRDEHAAETGSSKSEDGGDYDTWLAGELDLLVWCQYNYAADSNRMELALATCCRCIELDPENAEYQGRLEMLLARS